MRKLPTAITRAINLDCLIEHVLIDVRNLQHDDGRDVSLTEFVEMIRDPDYVELFLAVFKAATQVGQRRAEEREEAAGNLPTSSAGSSALAIS